jgi:hypothetical protein
MSAQPFDHLGVLVGGVVVDDGVNRLASRDLALDGVEEADELLMSVALRAAADDITHEDGRHRTASDVLARYDSLLTIVDDLWHDRP